MDDWQVLALLCNLLKLSKHPSADSFGNVVLCFKNNLLNFVSENIWSEE